VPGVRRPLIRPAVAAVAAAVLLLAAAPGAGAVTALPRYYHRDDIVSVPLSGAPPDRVLLATAARRTSPLVDGFIRAARRTAAEDGGPS
jgi:hypothetical protein